MAEEYFNFVEDIFSSRSMIGIIDERGIDIDVFDTLTYELRAALSTHPRQQSGTTKGVKMKPKLKAEYPNIEAGIAASLINLANMFETEKRPQRRAQVVRALERLDD